MNRSYYSILIGIIGTILLLFVPYAYHIDNGPGPDSIVAMLWDLRFDTPEPFFILIGTLWIFSEYNLIRIVFLTLYLIFLGRKIRSKYVIIAGIITDLAVLIISIPRIFIVNSEGETLSPVLIPIPTLVFFTILSVYLVKRINKSSKTKRNI